MEGVGVTPFSGFFGGKRVLVTGHTGFKGAWLCEWLLQLGARVTGFSDRVPTTPSLFEALGLAERLEDIRGDLRDFPAVEEALRRAKPEVVFHLAAQPLVRSSYDEPKATFDINVGGTVNLLEAVRRAGQLAALVVVSSDKCYENVAKTEGYRETDPLGGHDPYSASKGCTEIVAHAYFRSFFENRIPAATARAGNVIGGGDWALDRIVPDCVRAWSGAGDKVAILRNPASTRPWQHVLEPVSAYLWLAVRLGQGDRAAAGEAFNFGPSDANRSVEDLVKELGRTWSPGRWRVESPADAAKKEARLLQLDCSKARERLAWTSALPFAEAVAMTAEWYRTYAMDPASIRQLSSGQIARYVKRAQGGGLRWASA